MYELATVADCKTVELFVLQQLQRTPLGFLPDSDLVSCQTLYLEMLYCGLLILHCDQTSVF